MQLCPKLQLLLLPLSGPVAAPTVSFLSSVLVILPDAVLRLVGVGARGKDEKRSLILPFCCQLASQTLSPASTEGLSVMVHFPGS